MRIFWRILIGFMSPDYSNINEWIFFFTIYCKIDLNVLFLIPLLPFPINETECKNKNYMDHYINIEVSIPLCAQTKKYNQLWNINCHSSSLFIFIITKFYYLIMNLSKWFEMHKWFKMGHKVYMDGGRLGIAKFP